MNPSFESKQEGKLLSPTRSVQIRLLNEAFDSLYHIHNDTHTHMYASLKIVAFEIWRPDKKEEINIETIDQN